MKILIVNTSDLEGGAAIAAFRLNKSLLDQKVDCQMLVQSKKSDDFKVRTRGIKAKKNLNMLRSIIDSIPVRFYKERSKTLFSPSWLGFNNIIDVINKINPDLVHLHWINNGMIKIEDLCSIKVPLVWSLHDMWAFTGGCHYDEDCEGYKKSCGNCKVLVSSKSNDLSKKVYNRKLKTFSQIHNMTIIGLSNWINECSKNSTLLKDKRHVNLPNLIDTQVFKSLDKDKSRELWNFPKNKKLILFGAIAATTDARKGFAELSETLFKLTNKNIELVVFGSIKPKKSPNFAFKVHYLGNLGDDVSLATLFTSVDVTIVPSIQENLSNTILESLACATPVVGFNIGGNSDMIEHKKTGYLAEPFNTTDLAYGTEWVLNNKKYNQLCRNAREKVLKEFDSVIVAKKYIKLYKEIIDNVKLVNED